MGIHTGRTGVVEGVFHEADVWVLIKLMPWMPKISYIVTSGGS